MAYRPNLCSQSRIGFLALVALAVGAAVAFAQDQRTSVKGHVVFAGSAPAAIVLPMGSDPKCQEQHPGGFRFQPISVGGKGGLSDTFVYVKSGLSNSKRAAPPQSVKLDQKGCWYYPRVVGAMVGQRIEIKNSDPTMHNVNAAPSFNVAMPPGVHQVEESFDHAIVMQRLKCNVHPWMTAYVGVSENPFFAVTDKNGDYHIRGVPPGKYVLEAWHERLGVMTKEITVGKSGVVTADFTFSPSKGDL